MKPVIMGIKEDDEPMELQGSVRDVQQLALVAFQDWQMADQWLEKQGAPLIQDGVMVSMKERIEQLLKGDTNVS